MEKKKGIGLVASGADQFTKTICQSLAQEGVSAVVVRKPTTLGSHVVEPADALSAQWSGERGKDLFFNGWKLLF